MRVTRGARVCGVLLVVLVGLLTIGCDREPDTKANAEPESTRLLRAAIVAFKDAKTVRASFAFNESGGSLSARKVSGDAGVVVGTGDMSVVYTDVPTVTGAVKPPDVTGQLVVAALRHVEEAVTGITWADGIVLRYGGFYGPGTGIEAAPDAVMAELVCKGRFPIVGGGGGVWSMVHITDAASATVAAIERGKPGIYHVADDDPAPVREVLLGLARALGAKPPRRVPAWLARLLAGKGAVEIMTQARGISSEKAKRELGWTLQYPTWRTGFTECMG